VNAIVSTAIDSTAMPSPKIIGFSEPTASCTIAEALAFIERTRRQVDRFERLPRAAGQSISPEDAATLHRQCDELEADIKRLLSPD
jgi:hypothetical protein